MLCSTIIITQLILKWNPFHYSCWHMQNNQFVS
uniref:Uncharacterized protein n=1 Tax=Anguilla anguilla TaxID=7936 RepID=A0A0E9UFN2_ANGAN